VINLTILAIGIVIITSKPLNEFLRLQRAGNQGINKREEQEEIEENEN
jgi:hypothetical protein